MKTYSWIGALAVCIFTVLLVVKSQKRGQIVAREKKRLSLMQLEDHVVFWTVEQMEILRETIDIISDDTSTSQLTRELLYSDIAGQFIDLLELLRPIQHDEQSLVAWTTLFIAKHRIYEREIEN